MASPPEDRSDPTWHRVIEVPEHMTLTKKAARRGGPSPDELIARAEKALQGISGQFGDWTEQTLATLTGALALIRDHGMTDERAGDLFRAAHNIKGLAGTVGYPLAGRVSESLCHLIDRVENRARVPLVLVEQHVASITAIVHEKAAGEGTAIARTLVERLLAVTSEFVAMEVERQMATAQAAEEPGRSAA
jgi:chemotaxis protein histidine kinase CheA